MTDTIVIERELPPPPTGLWAALLKAQSEFPTIGRHKTAKVPTKSGGEYSYDYADLGDILRAVDPILWANGLVMTQPITITENGLVIRTTLVHPASGEREVADFPLPMDGAGAQAVGSLITYFRRYSAQAMLGIVTESDSDAQDVDVPRRSPQRSSAAPRRSGVSGAGSTAQTHDADLGRLLAILKDDVGRLDEGGRAEWEDYKSEWNWDANFKAGALTVEMVNDARKAVAGMLAGAGVEPY